MLDTSDHTQQPVYWFAVLDMARERGEFDRAAKAQRELKRLGVVVRFLRVEHREATPA